MAAPPALTVASGSPSTHAGAAFEACLRALERVEKAVEEETEALRFQHARDLSDFNRRKSHGLLELTRALRGLEPASAAPVIEPRLRSLRQKLDENSAVLKMHLTAVQEVSAIMSRAIRDGESDGTYSASLRNRGA